MLHCLSHGVAPGGIVVHFLWQEDLVNVLETDVGGLRVEEIDDRDECSVGAGEENVRFPSNPADQYRCHHDDEEVPQPAMVSTCHPLAATYTVLTNVQIH